MRTLLTSILILFSFGASAQNPEITYLLDSLDFDNYSEVDRTLTDSFTILHNQTDNDTLQLKYVMFLADHLAHNDWERYSYLIYDRTKTKVANPQAIEPDKREIYAALYGSALNNIAYSFQQRGDMAKAITLFHKVIEVHERSGHETARAHSLINLAMIYKSQDENEKALELLLEAEKPLEKNGDTWGLSFMYNNTGVIYQNFGDLDKAEEFYKKGLKLKEEVVDVTGIAFAYNNLGKIESYRGNYEKALEFGLKAVELIEPTGDLGRSGEIYAATGGFFLLLNENQKAEEYAKEGLERCLKGNYLVGAEVAAQHLYVAYQRNGKWQDAFETYEIYVTTRDSIKNEQTMRSIVSNEVNTEFEKKEAVSRARQYAELDKKEQLAKAEKHRRNLIILFGSIGIILVLTFAIFVVSRLRITRKQKSIIEHQKFEVEEAHEEIRDSITYAKRIQSAILPPSSLLAEKLGEGFVLYKPKDVVAGDFYWLEDSGDKILFAAADCTGHGVPGAMVSVVCNHALNRAVREFALNDPGLILDKARELVIQEFERSDEEVKDGMDIALCSMNGHKLEYAGAHNSLWIIRKDGDRVEEIKADKQPIGAYEDAKPFNTHNVDLYPGDSFFIFSDGFADQFGGEKGKKLKTANFKKLLVSVQSENMNRQKELIDTAFEEWRGTLEQLDDVCVIGVRV